LLGDEFIQEKLVSVRNMIVAVALVVVSFSAADGARAAGDASAQDKAAAFSVMRAIADTWNSGHGFATDTFESSLTIVDNTPPYLFQGPHAVDAWIEAYRDQLPKGSKDAKTSLHLSQPQTVEIEGTHAYIAVGAEWRVEQNGRSEVSHGVITAILHHSDEQWRVAAWTWTPR
jgi:hypothetical protein